MWKHDQLEGADLKGFTVPGQFPGLIYWSDHSPTPTPQPRGRNECIQMINPLSMEISGQEPSRLGELGLCVPALKKWAREKINNVKKV